MEEAELEEDLDNVNDEEEDQDDVTKDAMIMVYIFSLCLSNLIIIVNVYNNFRGHGVRAC